jgi:hypothetical protein
VFGTTWNAMHGRAMRTSCGSMPATVTSATAALARAASLLERTWAGLVGGAELHRSHRIQPAALLIADTCCSRLHTLIISIRVLIMSKRVLIMSIRVPIMSRRLLIMSIRVLRMSKRVPIMSIRLLIMSIRVMLAHGCPLQRALCTFAERSMGRSSTALLALRERAGKSTQERPARGAAWVNIGTVGSTRRVRFAPAQRTVPPLVGAAGLARRRLCCDKSRAIDIRVHYDSARHSRTSARSRVHLPAAALTGWLGSAHSRGPKRFLPARAERQSALLHARTHARATWGTQGYSGHSGTRGAQGYSGYSQVHRHRRVRTSGCEEALGSPGLRASKASTNKTARFLCALETTRSNQESSVLHSTRAEPHSPTRSVLAVTSGSRILLISALLWARFERRVRWTTARCSGIDGGTYVCGSAETDAAAA